MKKNLLILFLIAVIIGMTLSIEAKDKYSKYDLNRDGKVDEKDYEEMEAYCGKE